MSLKAKTVKQCCLETLGIKILLHLDTLIPGNKAKNDQNISGKLKVSVAECRCQTIFLN